MSDQQAIGPYLGSLVSFRRDIHANPELQYAEHRTAEKIEAWLTTLGMTVDRNFGQTGIVATLRGTGPQASDPSRAIALRADMDALPVQELNAFAHASTIPNCMHACGHDGHIAMLLGGATLLAQRPDFDGAVHFVFQPAEEGGGGAKAMIDDGLLKQFPVQAVFALHNWPALPAGQMGVRVGPIMAAANRFVVTVHGAGGHAARPHETVDPIPIVCAIVTELQRLVSRTVDPLDSAVVTVGKVEAGSVANIIPDTATIHGTCRALRPETQSRILAGVQRIATYIALAHGATADVTVTAGYPATVNHGDEAKFMASVMREVVGEANAHDDIEPALTAEDFGFMLEEVPGAYGFIGNGADGRPGVGLHSPTYDFNDDALSLGATFWERLVRQWFAAK